MTVALKSYDFVNSVGANTHLGFGTAGSLFSRNQTAINNIGIKNIRDPSWDATTLGYLQTLAASGVKIALSYLGDGPLADFITAAKALVASTPGCLYSVECGNEADISGFAYGGLTAAPAANQAQIDLWNAIKAEPTLASVKVLGWALAFPSDSSQSADLSAHCDYGNMHDYYYSSYDIPAADYMGTFTAGALAQAPNKAIVSTETGWPTASADANNFGCDNRTQSRLSLNLLLYHFRQGILKTYLYDLVDDNADAAGTDIEQHFGLYTVAGAAKTIATNLKSLLTILSDTNGNFTPGSLNYTITNLQANTGWSMLLQKSSGTFMLVLWNDQQNWNPGTRTAITVPARTVTVTLPSAYNVNVYDPTSASGATPTSSVTGVTSVNVSITDHPVILGITQQTAPPIGHGHNPVAPRTRRLW